MLWPRSSKVCGDDEKGQLGSHTAGRGGQDRVGYSLWEV